MDSPVIFRILPKTMAPFAWKIHLCRPPKGKGPDKEVGADQDRQVRSARFRFFLLCSASGHSGILSSSTKISASACLGSGLNTAL